MIGASFIWARVPPVVPLTPRPRLTAAMMSLFKPELTFKFMDDPPAGS
jgi:hypothetical protein